MVIAFLLAAGFGGSAAAAAGSGDPWIGRTVYFVVTDRFAVPPGRPTPPPCGDGTKEWCGGKLAGVTAKLDYIQSMGFDAVWVTPVVTQVEWRDNW
eukprot:SAG22_NODE_4964_length_1121_cov_1.394325_1_plen_96_part_10